jgi:hypothetical protein
MPKVYSNETEDWLNIPGGNRTNGKTLPDFHLTRHRTQQALLKGEGGIADSGTGMTEQEIARLFAMLTTEDARERFLRSLEL